VRELERALSARGFRVVDVLAGAHLTPGDLERLKDLVEAFGLRPLVIPDLSDSLDGHLADTDFSPLTIGGTPLNELATLGDARATLVIGASLYPAADLLHERTGVEDFRFDHLMGLEATDALIQVLQQLSGAEVPEKLVRQRAQLQDAMLDTHFMLGLSRIAIAADPDLLNGFSRLLAGMGAETVAAVTPANAPVLQRAACEAVKIGDLEDLRLLAVEHGAELLIGNSHAVESAARLGIPPTLRIGDAKDPVLKPWAAKLMADSNEEALSGRLDVPFAAQARCWPGGVPGQLIYPFEPLYFIQKPDEVWLIWQRDHMVRRVFLKNEHTKGLKPSWFGESIGHYENGNTLLVDTVGLAAHKLSYIDNFRTPHSERLHVVERFTLSADGNTLTAIATAEDPEAYNAPITMMRRWFKVNGPIVETICAENNGDHFNQNLVPIPEAEKPDF